MKIEREIERLLDKYYEGDGLRDYYKEVAIREYENGLTLEDIEELMMEAEL